MKDTYLFEDNQCKQYTCDSELIDNCFDDLIECFMDNDIGYKKVNGECIFVTDCDHYNEYCYITYE